MAWNEPGGNNSKQNDPWGRKPSDQGPPDLDEMLKKFFKRTFGGGSKRRGGSSGGDFNFDKRLIGVAFAVVAVLYFLSGIYLVQPAEVAVVTRFGQYVRTEGPGPHWLPRFVEAREIINAEQIWTTQHENIMLTQDENIVQVEMAIQYRISNAKDYLFNVVDPRNSLKQATDSAIRTVVGHSTLDHILTSGRSKIADDIFGQIDEILAIYQSGLTVTDVAMQPARAPNEVKEAFDDVIKAREDEIGEVNRAETYARRIEPIARGNAERARKEAYAYKEQVTLLAQGNTAKFVALLPQYKSAPKVTRERLYLSAIAEIMGKSNKVIMDADGGNLLYLPLDKLMHGQASTEDFKAFEPQKLLDESKQIADQARKAAAAGGQGSREFMSARERSRLVRGD